MRRGPRFVLQILLLPILYALAIYDEDIFQIVVAAIIIITWPITIAVATLLVWLARQAPEIESLTETADNAVTLAIVSTSLVTIAVTALARIVGIFELDGKAFLILLGYALVLIGAPSISWFQTTRHVWVPMIRRRS